MNNNFIIISGLSEPYSGLNFRKELPGWHLQEHKHDFHQFFYILEGSLGVRLSGHDYTINPGQFCIVPPYTCHELYTSKGYRQLGINLQSRPDKRGIIELLNGYFTRLTVLTKPYFLETIPILQRETKKLTPLSMVKLATLLDTFITTCIEDQIDIKESDFREKLVAILERHIHQHIRLSSIAAEMTISPTHLERLSKKEFGCGAMKLFYQMKMNYACSQLLNTPKTIKEIAYIIGYNDVAYFCRFFKKKLQMTPSEYRNNF